MVLLFLDFVNIKKYNNHIYIYIYKFKKKFCHESKHEKSISSSIIYFIYYFDYNSFDISQRNESKVKNNNIIIYVISYLDGFFM